MARSNTYGGVRRQPQLYPDKRGNKRQRTNSSYSPGPKKPPKGTSTTVVTFGTQTQPAKRRKLRIRFPRNRMRGYYKGRFRGPKSRRLNPYDVKGVHYILEQGGSVEDAQASYITVGATPARAFCEAVAGSIWKLFWEKDSNNQIDSWDNAITGTVGDNFGWIISYRTLQDGAVLAVPATITTGNQSHLTCAINLMNAIMNQMAANAYFELVQISAYHRIDQTVDDYVREARYKADDFSFVFNCKAHLKCQNRTLAATGGADESSMLDVANNPLEGKIYRGTGTINPIKHMAATLGGANASLSQSKDGGFGFLRVALLGAACPNSLTKPPPFSTFQYMRSHKNIRLAPGAIRSEWVSWKSRMTFRGFLKMFLEFLRSGNTLDAATVTPNVVAIPCVAIGMERMLDSRTAEPNIALSYELTHDVQMICRFKKNNFTAPRVVSGGAAVP